MKINKTSRRVGFHKMPVAKLPKLTSQIGGQIPTGMGAIKLPKVPKVPKMPSYGKFPKGHVY